MHTVIRTFHISKTHHHFLFSHKPCSIILVNILIIFIYQKILVSNKDKSTTEKLRLVFHVMLYFLHSGLRRIIVKREMVKEVLLLAHQLVFC